MYLVQRKTKRGILWFGFHKWWKIYWLGERQLASEDNRSYMDVMCNSLTYANKRCNWCITLRPLTVCESVSNFWFLRRKLRVVYDRRDTLSACRERPPVSDPLRTKAFSRGSCRKEKKMSNFMSKTYSLGIEPRTICLTAQNSVFKKYIFLKASISPIR